jgi:hypothetical protein
MNQKGNENRIAFILPLSKMGLLAVILISGCFRNTQFTIANQIVKLCFGYDQGRTNAQFPKRSNHSL